jgi:hypothetical protein
MKNRLAELSKDALFFVKLAGIAIVSIIVTAATISNTTKWWLEFLFKDDATIPVLANIATPIAAAFSFFSIFGLLVSVSLLVAFVKNEKKA